MSKSSSELPQHEGRPVPWVTRWSGEANGDALSVGITAEAELFLHYKDGNENRDEADVLWKREGLGRHGVPQYSEVNTYRQRASMLKQLCQVCGSKIDERPIRWLMSRDQLVHDDGVTLTMSPPTCASCIPVAMTLCPFLKRGGALIVKVLEYSIWGVHGQPAAIDPEGRGRQLPKRFIPYVDPPVPLAGVLAYQQVVELAKFVIEGEA